MDTLVYWIWLSLCVTPASETFSKLYTHTPDPEGIFALEDDVLTRLLGSGSRDGERLRRHDLSEAARVAAFCRDKHIGIVTYADENYPPLLRNIPNPPVLLYYRGVWPNFAASFPVAVVGTRHMSDYGRKSAFYISLDLSRAGATIVSGMACGVDAMSHAGALAADAVTVAVLGCGIDICYPTEHLTLARSIVKQGCVLTEYAPGTPPLKFHFPQRNRIISGLCAATIVIEGRERSGSLITARCAMTQGRTVYALPGNVDAETSEVTALLLKNGAHALTCADDVLRDFEFVYTGIVNPYRLREPISVSMESTLKALGVGNRDKRRGRGILSVFSRTRAANDDQASEPTPPSIRELPALSDEEQCVYDRLPDSDACDIESLVNDSCSLRELMRILLRLEIKGCIELHPGERVSRK